MSLVSIGLHGGLDAASIRVLAPQIEAAGFHGLWLNDTPGGDALAGLRAAAGVTTTLRLGVGVIPVDRRPASEIAAALGALPSDRLTIGIGSGGPRDALARVSAAVAELRGATAASLVIGALGPRMRELAAREADGVLLNWLTPSAAVDAMNDLRHDAAGRPVRGILYARTALEPDALPALREEAQRYGSFPSYAANFERIGATAMQTTIDATTEALSEQIARFEVDELVLRAITADLTVQSLARFIQSAAA